MEKLDTIKIFLSYHKNTERLQNDILTPIQVGKQLAKNSLEDMIGDNEAQSSNFSNNGGGGILPYFL